MCLWPHSSLTDTYLKSVVLITVSPDEPKTILTVVTVATGTARSAELPGVGIALAAGGSHVMLATRLDLATVLH